MKPNREKLKKSIRLLAKSMNFSCLPEINENQLIEHVLFHHEYDGVDGKNGWVSYQNYMISQSELRNLFMSHSATKIAQFSKRFEPNWSEYTTKKICQKFEIASLGNIIFPSEVDVLDPWERN